MNMKMSWEQERGELRGGVIKGTMDAPTQRQRGLLSLSGYLELIRGGVWCLWGVYPEDISQAAGHQQTHVLVWVFQKEVRSQMESQVQVQLLLFLRILIHVHEGLYHHLEECGSSNMERPSLKSALNQTSLSFEEEMFFFKFL